MHLDDFFRLMVERKASDLHLSSDCAPMFRIAGDMTPVSGSRLTKDEVRTLIHEIIPERNSQEFEQTHDTDFGYELAGVARFRCNVFADRHGIGAVFRLIPSKILSFKELGLPETVKKLCFLTKGLVLVTGPTGSGKSTTLAAMIDFINMHRSDHIITIEDPIEFVHLNKRCLVNQREVHVNTESFKRALRAALREDPDIVMVGEMRDLETVKIALECAETGHVVFGTLHTTTAVSTIDRLINQFPADDQPQVRAGLADGLKGVIAQTLCKRKTGGRVAALEILLASYAVSANIREGKIHQIPMAMTTGRKDGMCFLNDSLLDLLQRDLIEPTDAYQKSVLKEDLIKRMAAIPHLRSPKGAPWTEEDLLQHAAHAADPTTKQPFAPPPMLPVGVR